MAFNRNFLFLLLLFFCFLLLSGFLLLVHEPWRDELQSWDLARQSHSLAELFYNSRYEGHPAAWYLILFSITRFTWEFAVVQWFNWLLMTVAVALFIWRSPFSLLQKSLGVFGYFFLYEYTILARNYALGVLAAFLICTLLKDRRKNWFWIHAGLFLLLQCNVFSAILATAVFVPLWISGLKILQTDKLFARKFIAGSLTYLTGAALSAMDMMPPAGSAFMPEWKWAAPEILQAAGAFVHALLPVPEWRIDFWNSHFLSSLVTGEKLLWLEGGLAVLLLAACVWVLRTSRFALVFFLLAVAAICVFLSVKYVGFLRHHGHYYLALVMALWITKLDNPARRDRVGDGFFTFLLAVHVLAAWPAIFFDKNHKFSQSAEVAGFILKNKLETMFIAGHFDYSTSPVSFHLNRPIYYPNAEKAGTFIIWSDERFTRPVDDIIKTANEIYQEKRVPFLLLTSYPLLPEKAGICFHLLKEFSPSIVKTESYWLYEINCK